MAATTPDWIVLASEPVNGGAPDADVADNDGRALHQCISTALCGEGQPYGRLLKALTDLRSKADLALPTIVVCGTQSHGKSSTLERIVQQEVFPRDARLCTRMVFRLLLRNTPGDNKLTKARIFDTETEQVIQPSTPFAEGTAVPDALKAIMDEFMNEKHGANSRAIDGRYELQVMVSAPNVPTIDIVELPGVINTTDGTVSNELTKHFLAKEHTLVLVIASALDTTIEVNPIWSLVHSHNRNPAVVALTYMDWTKQTDEDLRNILQKHEDFAPVGDSVESVIPVVNRNTRDKDEQPELNEALDAETRALTAKLEEIGIPFDVSQHGIRAVVQVLSEKLHQYMANTWVLSELVKLTGDLLPVANELRALGTRPDVVTREEINEAIEIAWDHLLSRDLGEWKTAALGDASDAESGRAVPYGRRHRQAGNLKRQLRENREQLMGDALRKVQAMLVESINTKCAEPPLRLSRFSVIIERCKAALTDVFEEHKAAMTGIIEDRTERMIEDTMLSLESDEIDAADTLERKGRTLVFQVVAHCLFDGDEFIHAVGERLGDGVQPELVEDPDAVKRAELQERAELVDAAKAVLSGLSLEATRGVVDDINAVVGACREGRVDNDTVDILENVRKTGLSRGLHAACEAGHESVVSMFLEAGADPNAKNESGETPLHVACRAGHQGITKLLLAKGAEPNAEDSNGVTPLLAASEGNEEGTAGSSLERATSVHALLPATASRREVPVDPPRDMSGTGGPLRVHVLGEATALRAVCPQRNMEGVVTNAQIRSLERDAAEKALQLFDSLVVHAPTLDVAEVVSVSLGQRCESLVIAYPDGTSATREKGALQAILGGLAGSDTVQYFALEHGVCTEGRGDLDALRQALCTSDGACVRTLRELTLSSCIIDTATCEVLGTALGSALHKLKLEFNTGVGDDGGEALAQGLLLNKTLTELELELRDCGIGSNTCYALGQALGSGASALCKLVLSGNKSVGDADGKVLAQGASQSKTLTELDLSCCGIGSETCSVLCEALGSKDSVLRKLMLSGNTGVGDAGGQALAHGLLRNKTLAELELGSCGIGSNTCYALGQALGSGASALCKLVLSGNKSVGDADGKVLAQGASQSKTLTELDLSCCGIGSETCSVLCEALGSKDSVLRKLMLSGNTDVGDAGGQALARGLLRNKTLTELNLAECDIGSATCKALGSALGSAVLALRKLVLRGNKNVDDGAGAALVELLSVNRTLTELKLAECNIGLATCKALGKALASSGVALQKLVLGDNEEVQDGGGEVLAEGLRHNTKLAVLKLSGCGIGSATCKALGEALEFEHSALRKLVLRDNAGVQDPGSTALAKGLLRNKTLTELVLSECDIGMETCMVLGEALADNKSLALRHLRLGGNRRVEVLGGNALAQGLEQNKSLTELDLDRCDIGPAASKLRAVLDSGTSALRELGLGDHQANERTEGLVLSNTD